MNYYFTNHHSETCITLSDDYFDELQNKLSTMKEKIDAYPKQWEIVKKMIHDYEYVYTSSYFKKNICQFVPISRSFFKLQEIMYTYAIHKIKLNKCVALAEAPGGFIQCLRKLYPKVDIYGITLLSNGSKIPYWNSTLVSDPKTYLLKGIEKNGDLYSLQNVLSFIKDIGKSSVDFITGDGGIDYSKDYNHQEKIHYS